MYHFEITKHKTKEEFILTLMSTKKGEMLLKLAGFETKANATKVAKKLMELTAETEIRDLSKPAKVEKTPVKKTSSAKKPAKKAAQKSEK